MIHPMRVEWTLPDEAKRGVAKKQMVRDLDRMRSGHRLDDMGGLKMQLAAVSDQERDRVLAERYPDLYATITRFGTLLSVRYVPAQYALATSASGRSQQIELCKAKWVALVATETGTVEMDPLTLRVMWSSAGGDPIGGVVDPSEITLRGATRAENVAALEHVLDAYKQQ